MADDATRPDGARPARWTVAPASIVVALLGVFLIWTRDGPVELDGTDGPNNGWLVVIFCGFAAYWLRSLARGSWFGVIGVLGSAAVIAWTAVENWLDSHAALDAGAGVGLLLVLIAAAGLAWSATSTAVERRRARTRL